MCACAFLCVPMDFGGRISRTRLAIEPPFQWTTNRKWPVENRLVTWSMTSRDLERSRSWPHNVSGPLSRKRLEIQTRFHIGNDICGIKWSYDRWRHVTLKGEGRDLDIFRCKYLAKRLEIEEIEVSFKWTTNRKWPMANRLVTWSMTSHDSENSRAWTQNIWGQLSRKLLEIQTLLQ